jgi:hypothetical protein
MYGVSSIGDATASRAIAAARVVGAGLGGAAIGALVGWAFDAAARAATAANDACQSQSQDGFCLALGYYAAALAGSVAIICVGTLITMAALRVRPRRLTVPLGCIVIATAMFFTGVGFPGGHAPPPWATAIAASAGLAAVALSVADSGRAQLAGWAALVVVVLAALIVPRVVANREQTDGQVATLTRLGFPLQEPSVAGYYPTDGYATPGGSLQIWMQGDGAGPDTAAAFTVEITTVGSTDGTYDATTCTAGEHPDDSCQAEGPGRWLVTFPKGEGDEALAEKGGMIVVAQPVGATVVPAAVLLQAVTSLRPATAAAINALGR